jgi:DHA1 family tetracycline resistance protein-like MFS transporter
MSVTSIVGPPLMTTSFAYFTGPNKPFYFPGISFLIGSVLMLLSAILAYRALKIEKEHIMVPVKE